MDIEVRKISPYLEVIIKEGNATLETGLISKEEAVDLATHFIGAAEDLLTGFAAREQLMKIREVL